MPSEQQDEFKRRAAIRAADWIEDGMVVGLGTGSTVRFLLDHIAERRAGGAWQSIVGVPTSSATARQAELLGIPLASLEEQPRVDLTIDGADEVDPELRLIKGLGAALLREKIVASNSSRFVVIVDESKLVARLGTRAPLPVEVDRFGHSTHLEFFAGLGAEPSLRRTEDGAPLVSDGGHYIYDCRFPDGIADPEALDLELARRPGVVESGLFLGMTSAVVVAAPDGVRVMGEVAR
jgi:ribose 5-phosphate isomerase A